MEKVILEDIYWDITLPPRQEARIIDIVILPIEEDTWRRVILPGNNFTIIYPLGIDYDISPIVPYEAEGTPVTLEDLLTTIYEYYQELILPDELRELTEDANYTKPFNHRYDAIKDDWFRSLEQVSPNVYKLNLGN